MVPPCPQRSSPKAAAAKMSKGTRYGPRYTHSAQILNSGRCSDVGCWLPTVTETLFDSCVSTSKLEEDMLGVRRGEEDCDQEAEVTVEATKPGIWLSMCLLRKVSSNCLWQRYNHFLFRN